MDKKKIKRHNLVFISDEAKQKILVDFKDNPDYQLLEELFEGPIDTPGFIRRPDSVIDNDCISLGFVHSSRYNGKRFRFGVEILRKHAVALLTPYDVFEQYIRKDVLDDASYLYIYLKQIKDLAKVYNVKLGILGSISLELITGRSYTDENSDIDLLVSPAPYETLQQFYKEANALNKTINLDLEVDLPNGFGVKLTEVFMETSMVLGKSLNEVKLLYRSEIEKFLV